MRVRTRININAPPARIYRLLDDPNRRKQWLAGLVETRQTCGTPGQAGSTFVETFSDGRGTRDYQSEIIAAEFPRKFSTRQNMPTISVTSQWKLEPDGSTTRIQYDADMQPRGLLLKIMSFFTRTVVKRIMNRQLRQIKAMAESKGGG